VIGGRLIIFALGGGRGFTVDAAVSPERDACAEELPRATERMGIE